MEKLIQCVGLMYKSIADARNKRRRELYALEKQKLDELTDKEFIKLKIESGEWGTVINSEKQLPHMESTKIKGKSYLYDTEDPQKLFDKYSGNCIIKIIKNGNRTNREWVVTDYIISVDETNGETNELKIHHSKGRTHIVPEKEVKK